MLANADFPEVSCEACKQTYLDEGEAAACITGRCPVNLDRLPDEALRLLELRGLLVTLNDLHLSDRICDEYGVDLHDLRLLADIETLLKTVHAAKEGTKDGGS